MENESNKIASNTLTQILGRIVVIALALVSTKFITNYLGPGGTGFYTTIITYLSFFIVIADFGLFSVAVREISKNQGAYRKILSNVFLIRLISAITAGLLAVFIIFLTGYPAEIKYGVVIASLFLVFNLVSSVFDMLFQARLEMQKVALAEVISKIFALLSVILSVYLNLGFYFIVGTVSFAAILNFLIKWLYSRKALSLTFRHDSSLILNIVKMAAPLGVVFIVNNIYFKIDSLMLFYYKGAIDVGIYAVSYRVLETTLFAGSYLSSSLKPLLSVSVNKDQEKTNKALSHGFIFLLFMAVCISIVCVTFSREIILFLSNKEFVSGAKASVILGFAPIFIYLSGMMGEIMIARDMRKSMILISSFILIFNILLNMLLIPKYGFVGAAASTLVSEIILLTISWWAVRRSIEFDIDFIKITKLILTGIVISTAGYFLKRSGINFILNISLLLLGFAAFSYWIKAIPRETVSNYITSVRRRWTS